MTIAETLLREPQAAAEREPAVGRLNVKLVALGVLGTAAYGAAVGCYVGRAHIALTAVKMPVFFLATLALTFAVLHVVAVASRAGLTAGRTLTVALTGIGVTALVLGALAPPIALVGATSAMPDYSTYLSLVLINTFVCVVAGFFGVRAVARTLRRLAPESAGRILAAWIVVYPFVGAQVAWILRPWIGSSYDIEGLYSLQHGLEGNFYVAVWEAIVNWFRYLGGAS